MVYQGHTGPVSWIQLSSDSQLLFTCSTDKTIKAYNIANGQVQMTYTGHTGIVYCICLSLDNK